MTQPAVPSRRRRRGSVMIMVVALLVLMALIGTAYIANSRMARGTSAAQVDTARLDHLADGVKDMATAALVKDLTADTPVWMLGKRYVIGQIVAVETNPADGARWPKEHFLCVLEHDSTLANQPMLNYPANPPAASPALPPEWVRTTAPPPRHRPASGELAQYNYTDGESPMSDLYLADRIPMLTDNVNGFAGTPDLPTWRSVSWPLLESDPLVPYRFDVPLVPRVGSPRRVVLAQQWTPTVNYFAGQIAFDTLDDGARRFYLCVATNAADPTTNRPPNSEFWLPCEPKQYQRFIPTSIVAGNGQVYPALRMYNDYVGITGAAPGLYDVEPADGSQTTIGDTIFVAADADGDGIADSGLWELPVEQKNGVKFYAGIRIVDNNAAVNVATAWRHNDDYFATAPEPFRVIGSFFPSNVSLESMLNLPAPVPGNRAQAMGILNAYRFFDPSGSFTARIVNDGMFAERNDARFTSPYEELWIQQGRRTTSGGTHMVNFATDATTTFHRVPESDAAALAHRLTLINPSSSPALSELNYGSPPFSLGSVTYFLAPNFNSRFAAYPTAGALQWFDENFYLENFNHPMGTIPAEYDAAAGFMYQATANPPTPGLFRNVRSLLTTTNGASTAMPALFEGENTPTIPANVEPFWFGPPAAPLVPINLPPVADGIIHVNVSFMLPYGTKGRWAQGVQYKLGDIVYRYDNETGRDVAYVARIDNPATNPNLAPFPPLLDNDDWLYYAGFRGVWNTLAIYQAGEFVQFNRNTYFCILNGTTGAGMQPDVAAANWVLWKPDAGPTPKVSPNTATFGELWRGYWNVMADGPGRTPFDRHLLSAVAVADADAAVADTVELPGPLVDPLLDPVPGFFDPYIGSQFLSAAPFFVDLAFVSDTPDYPQQHPLRMFRSPIRAVPEPYAAVPAPPFYRDGTPRMSAYNTLLLRAAIAAVNTEDLRDSDNDITARMIRLSVRTRVEAWTAAGGQLVQNRPVNVTVYGTERQPYITEVYATGAGIAIELHNPYPVPLPLRGFRLATLDRSAPAGGGTSYLGLSGATEPPHLIFTDRGPIPEEAVGTPYVIPPNGYRVLVNDLAFVPPVPIDPVFGVPIVVPELITLIGDASQELVLLRSKRADGKPSIGPNRNFANAPILEPEPYLPFGDLGVTPAALAEMVPIDSFDFTGITGIGAESWHYVRASHRDVTAAPVSLRAWRCVYPGRYDATKTLYDPAAGIVPAPRHQGTKRSASAPPETVPGLSLGVGTDATGAPDEDTNNNNVRDVGELDPAGGRVGVLDDPAAASYPTEFTVQLNNTGWAGPNKLHDFATAPPDPNRFPYGGFARNGDLLQVPYFGAYRIQFDEAPAHRDGGWVLEMNAAPMDCSLVEDTDAQTEDLNNDGDVADAMEDGGVAGTWEPNEDVNLNGFLDKEDVNNNGILDPLADTTEEVGRFIPNARDFEKPHYGTVTAATPDSVTDAIRVTTIPDLWCTYDIEILTGPAAGQVRRVINFDEGAGEFDVNHDWVIEPPGGSVYRLTKRRYAWAADLFEYFSVLSPHDDYLPEYPETTNRWINLADADPDPDYFVGDVVRINVPGPGPLTGVDRLFVCILDHDSTAATDPLVDATNWQELEGDAAAMADVAKVPVRNSDAISTPNAAQERGEKVEGLININTASWKALAALPMVIDPETGEVLTLENEELARAIVYFRDVDGDPDPAITIPHGPFKSIFELNMVEETRFPRPLADPTPAANGTNDPVRSFRNAYGTLIPLRYRLDTLVAQDQDWDDVDGDISPLNMTPPGAGPVIPQVPRQESGTWPAGTLPQDGLDLVRDDFEEKHLVLNRISNMITTRSDSFTVYAVVEGWINAGTPLAERVSQKRIAFIADRSQVKGLVSPQSQTVLTTPVPTD